MLFVLSPAKKLDYDSSLTHTEHTQPQFVAQAQTLIAQLKTQSVEQIQALMKLSPALAQLNVERYQQWQPHFTLSNARPAIYAFNGDVYEGLAVRQLSADSVHWLQSHLAILSGLYGVLRPLDLMQAYRLEMGTKLATTKGKDLYQFWGSQIADYLQQQLDQQDHPVLVNTASVEYFKAIQLDHIKAPVVQCVFQEKRQGVYKIISINAKRARGLMVRFAAMHQIDQLQGLKDFNLEGYHFDASASSTDQLIFRKG